jgi:hypothetical protein
MRGMRIHSKGLREGFGSRDYPRIKKTVEGHIRVKEKTIIRALLKRELIYRDKERFVTIGSLPDWE